MTSFNYKKIKKIMNITNASCISGSLAYVTKTCSIDPHVGHIQKIPYNYDEEKKLTYNRLGCPNPGIDYYDKHPYPFILSILPECLKYNFDRMKNLKGIEVNVSCPNLIDKSIPAFCMTTMEQICMCIRDIRKQWPHLTVALKLPYYGCTHMIKRVAFLCSLYNVSYVICCNSFSGLFPDSKAIVGISSPHFRPLVLGNCKSFISHGVSVVGCCGVSSQKDVDEFLSIGCIGVQIGSELYRNPGILSQLSQLSSKL